MRTFVIGDIHGAYKALLQCLEVSKFNKREDRLICLGDVCDRGKQVKKCIDELLTIPKCVYILGNHDAWALEWAVLGRSNKEWLKQGGDETIVSYKATGMTREHIRFLAQSPVFYELFLKKDFRLFVHGGFDQDKPIYHQNRNLLVWDRELIYAAWKRHLSGEIDYKFGPYKEIYVGHTPTENFGSIKPLKLCNVWAMDTGVGCGGRLTIMDVHTKEFWQSDLA